MPKTTSSALQPQKDNRPFFSKEGDGAFFSQDQLQLKAGREHQNPSPFFGNHSGGTPFFTPFNIQPKAIFESNEEQPVQRKCSESSLSFLSNQTVQRASMDSTRRLTRDVSESIRVGTIVTYRLEQTGAEISAADSMETFLWKVYKSSGEVMAESNTDSPQIQSRALYPGDYRIEVTILRDGASTGRVFDLQQNVFMERTNTELGQLSVGNFDFLFDGNTIEVNARVKFQFEDTIAPAEQTAFKFKFFDAIADYWTSSGYSLIGEGNCNASRVPINISATEVTDSTYHKLVDVEKDYRRPNVISDMNLYLGIGKKTIAHEFGHVLGLYDEYDGGFFENRMFWHDNRHHADTDALMNTGNEMRSRYFQHFRDTAQQGAQPGCEYVISGPPPIP